MRPIDNIKLTSTTSIKEALKIIDSGAMQIAIVVDDNDRLIGTLTDGDIRRGLLNGLMLDSTIESIIFKNPTVSAITETKEEILQKALLRKIYHFIYCSIQF